MHLPRAMVGADQVATTCTTYGLVCVPFGWHPPPGPVQHVFRALLSKLRDTKVVFVHYQDDILFVG